MSTPPADLAARHLAKIVDSSDDAIVSKDLNGVITSWNSAAERMFGYTPEEAIGQSIRMIIPRERQSEEDFVLGRIRAGQAVRHYETIRCRKDGSRVPISLTVSPIYDADGTVIGASKIARDITDKRQAELAAKRLAALVESSDDAIMSKDLNSTIVSWNRAAERMFGYTAEEAIGRSIRMIIPPELQGEEDDVLRRIRAGQTVDHYETRRRRKDGTDLLISLTVSPIVDDVGVVVGASKIARDITERSRLRAMARQQAAITRQLSDAGVTIAASLDRGTIVQTVTDISTDLCGAEFGAFFYRVFDQAGQSSTLYTVSGVSKDVFANVPEAWAALFAPTFDGQSLVRIHDVAEDPRYAGKLPVSGMPAGHPRVRSYLAVPVRSKGAIIGGLFFGHSSPGMFTEQHQQLSTGIASWASVALENARLYQQAREADRLKDEFLAVLSHELRTPLNAILGYARLLRGGILSDEKAARGLETLERNASALTQIVEDVLDVSRIVAGKIRLDVRAVELPLVVHNAVATVQPAADAKGVRLVAAMDSSIGPVSGDPDRLQQVVWNLLANAVKFTPNGGRVDVTVQRADSHVDIVVTDTGVGIPPEFLPHVFERFRQADAGTTRKAGGLGLGLSIVRNIVEMHGGSVHATSGGDGRGATFRVRLPVLSSQAESVRETRDPKPAAASPPLTRLGDLSGVRVLAIDDEEDALGLLRLVLETAGADVVTMTSGLEALDRVELLAPHAIVVDLAMPDIDGFEFISRLRSQSTSARDIPAAAVTAFARSDDRTRALHAGFEMHLAKPVDPGELVASVATLVRRRPKP